MKLIVNADDMGFCEGVNAGVISAYKKGIVTSCTVMATMPGFDDAVERLKENPGLGSGVHLTLSAYSPLLSGHKTIVNEEGKFFKYVTEEIANTFDKEEILKEFTAQIEKVIANGLTISHFDSHHHVHQLPQLQWVMQQLVNKYKLPVRGGMAYTLENTKVVPLIDTFYKETVSVEYFEKNMDEICKHDVVDIMAHPAWVDAYLLNSTSYAVDRATEYGVLTSPEVIKVLEDKGIELVNYSTM